MYFIVVLPVATPPTVLPLMVATAVLLLVHVPPVLGETVVVLPWQIEAVVTVRVGTGTTVKVAEAADVG